MRVRQLHALAAAAGVLVDWVDAAGQRRRVPPASLHAVLAALERPAASLAQCRDSLRRQQADDAEPAPLLTVQVGERLPLRGAPRAACRWTGEQGTQEAHFDARGMLCAPMQCGYWTLHHGPHVQQVAVAPQRCFGVRDACAQSAPRAWGISVQVYSARSVADAGIGDANGCAHWLGHAAAAGADALALSPVHAARSIDRTYSPYAPSDRRFLDPLYAAPVRVLGALALDALAAVPGLHARFDALHDAPLIDWPAAAAAKWEWLRRLHLQVSPVHPEFAAFRARQDAESMRFAHFAAADFGDRDPDVQVFAQWLAARSWADTQREARAHGMKIGLIADLAVGFDLQGAEAAAAADTLLHGLMLGAPPDAFNAAGQVWGIGTYSPSGLRRSGYAPYIALLRAVLRDRGGIRIDHILGLLRLWVVPLGASSGDGAYLAYPLQDLLNLLALESWRHRAIVIGEDLGVVPVGIRAELARRGVMGLDVLMFTRDKQGGFLPPAQWRADAVATTTTHDLPTLRGWRAGRDIAWRQALSLCDAETIDQDRQEREHDIARLHAVIARQGLDTGAPFLDTLRFTASSPSPLALLPAEDALALDEQPNLPGTVEVHPNWRRRLPEPLPYPQMDAALHSFAEARRVPADLPS